MKVTEIQGEDRIRELRSGWTTLLETSASNTVFLTWEWLTAWWHSYGTPGQLRILAAHDDGGILRGIAPLRSHTLRRYGRSVPALSFIGDGSNDSDYLDFIIAAGYEEQVMAAFAAHWRAAFEQGLVLSFNEMPANSPNVAILHKMGTSRAVILRDSEIPCGTVPLPPSWEEYLSTLRPRFRTKVRSVLRHLEGRQDVRFSFCESAEQADGILPVLFDLHTKRWAQEGKPGVFRSQPKRDFYHALSPVLLERGWLRFSWLEWNGRILACQYGFEYGGTYFHLQEGYEPGCEHWNVGIGLRAWSIRELLRQGVREYDFLSGLGRHKSDWGAEPKQSRRVLLAHDSYTNRILCHGPEWESRARECVAQLLPGKLLSARRERIRRQSLAALGGAANNHSGESGGKEWLRQAAAGCYVHLGFPALIRPVRDRYQLSRPANGPLPISCSRRKEPCGRVLYYHRVNDDHDPFFPATPIDVFDRQMRFLARHYQVVTLDRLMDCLEGSTPENLVAITFDDGYQDNFRNAAPILWRYGFPATIFLTTGSIDTPEPLWFEKLASALKTTDREFVDLEIDIPVRYRLKTTAERLGANNRIFTALRALPDSKRRYWLTQILRQLAPRRVEASAMLTWDEVRVMKGHGIDFGGHTVTHPFLSRMAPQEAAWEVSECKRRIEAELQAPVRYFAYPNGREEDFSSSNKELLRAAGYRAAASTIWGMNFRSTDRMELKRGQPWEEKPSLFAYKFDWYQLMNE